jgi:hypothetical protein
MKELFPSSKLTKEKFMGMTKSFVVHNFEIWWIKDLKVKTIIFLKHSFFLSYINH